MRKYIKFKGNFRDLIPLGFKFWKAFARNYRVYTWRLREHGPSFSIWQHLGGYLEIQDYFGSSYVFIEAMQDGTLDSIVSGRDNNQYWMVLNQQTEKLVDRRDAEHVKDRRNLYYQVDKEFNDELLDEYCSKWREVNFNDKLRKKLQELLDKGLIEVVEDTEHKIYSE